MSGIGAAEAVWSRLAEKALGDPWALDTAVDWRQPLRPPPWLPRRLYVDALSQLYHGEQAALDACRTLARRVPEPEARRFLQLQAAEEERHVAAYGRYLGRLGDIRPADPALAQVMAAALAWPGPPQALVAACHAVLEAEALRLHGEMAERFPCPLLRSIHRRLTLDEARHVAFGRHYLMATSRDLALEARVEIRDWVEELWFAAAGRSAGGRFLGRVRRAALERRWQRHRATLAGLGLVPAELVPAEASA